MPIDPFSIQYKPAHDSRLPNDDWDGDFSALVILSTLLIAKEEGYRSKPYLCSEGYPTVGYGQRIGAKNQPLNAYQFTVPELVARLWLQLHVTKIIEQVNTHPETKAAFLHCGYQRQIVLVSMAYQLGISGLAGFSKMLKALSKGNWHEAHKQALDSLWAKQTANRAQRHATILLTAELPSFLSLEVS